MHWWETDQEKRRDKARDRMRCEIPEDKGLTFSAGKWDINAY